MAKPTGLDALTESARRSRNYAGGLLSEFGLKTAAAILETYLDTDTVTIKADEWQKDSTEKYPAYYDIAAGGLSAKDRADVIFPLSSLSAAENCGVSSTVETLAGKIRLRAMTAPTGDLTAQIWITHVKETQNAGNDE